MNSTCKPIFGLGLFHALDTSVKQIAFASFAICLATFSAVSNCFVIYAVKRHKPLFKNHSNMWLCALAATDISTAVVMMPLYAYANLRGIWDLGPLCCKVR